jgi:tetratricopeptide (TPR) repeat protein
VFVGEPTGGRPNHYGDARRVTLPNSGLEVSISTLYWQDGGPMDERPWVPPDIAVDVAGADYAAGRDPVLEAVLATDATGVGPPFEQTLTETFQSEGIDAALAAYRAYKDDPAHRYADTESFMNRAGYWLLQNHMVEAAILIFQANVEDYPDSWNVYDSLGEALLEAGRHPEAAKSYQRSLEMNPSNEGARRALERMRALAGDGHPNED